jgi:hypothetical protein
MNGSFVGINGVILVKNFGFRRVIEGCNEQGPGLLLIFL